jgi:hypothetical protein
MFTVIAGLCAVWWNSWTAPDTAIRCAAGRLASSAPEITIFLSGSFFLTLQYVAESLVGKLEIFVLFSGEIGE